jgi:hypothetical protein
MTDRTWIAGMTINKDDGSITNEFMNDVYYKDYPDYENLPAPCKCEDIKKEHEAYWKHAKATRQVNWYRV